MKGVTKMKKIIIICLLISIVPFLITRKSNDNHSNNDNRIDLNVSLGGGEIQQIHNWGIFVSETNEDEIYRYNLRNVTNINDYNSQINITNIFDLTAVAGGYKWNIFLQESVDVIVKGPNVDDLIITSDISYIEVDSDTNVSMKFYEITGELITEIYFTDYDSMGYDTLHLEYWKAKVPENQMEYYDLGFYYGQEKGEAIGYSRGLQESQTEAYNEGFKKGSNDTFMANLDKWIVPAIFLILVIGGFLVVRSRKSDI